MDDNYRDDEQEESPTTELPFFSFTDDGDDETSTPTTPIERRIIDGKVHATQREEMLRKSVLEIGKPISIVSILIGNDPPSVLYTNLKQKKASQLGIDFKALRLAETISFDDVSLMIKRFNEDRAIDGIMIQLPLPRTFLQGKSAKELTELIDPQKDIDGLSSGRLVPPAAVAATMCLIAEEGIELSGMKTVVLGNSDLVGKPIADELRKKGAEVTVIDSKTEQPDVLTKAAQLIVTAVGKPGILTGEMVSEGVIVLDIGTLVIEDELTPGEVQKKVVGDVDFESVFPKATKITPVPGGVGPMTIIALLENCVELVGRRKSLESREK